MLSIWASQLFFLPQAVVELIAAYYPLHTLNPETKDQLVRTDDDPFMLYYKSPVDVDDQPGYFNSTLTHYFSTQHSHLPPRDSTVLRRFIGTPLLKNPHIYSQGHLTGDMTLKFLINPCGLDDQEEVKVLKNSERLVYVRLPAQSDSELPVDQPLLIEDVRFITQVD